MTASSVTAVPVLELLSAGRRYGQETGLRPVTLRVGAGSTALVHGANGSGKTTLLRLCAGLLTPTSGERRATGRCVYLRPGSGTRRRQRVRDALADAASLSGGAASRVEEALEVADLGSLAARRVESLSSGQRGRLLVGVAVATRCEVACLDEPTAHLDERGVDRVRECVHRLAAAGTAVLVATHDRDLLGRRPDARLLVERGRVRSCDG